VLLSKGLTPGNSAGFSGSAPERDADDAGARPDSSMIEMAQKALKAKGQDRDRRMRRSSRRSST